MLPDAGVIDAALVARLGADSQLLALMPDGVFFDEAPHGAQRFVLVTLVSAKDVATQGRAGERRAMEDIVYEVTAVMLGSSAPECATAATRIDALLEDQPLDGAGYDGLACYRVERVRTTATDRSDAALRWQVRGGRYRVQVAPIPAAVSNRRTA